MPDGQRKYTKELGRALHCSHRTRKQLMEQFNDYQHQILDDLPTPTYEQMVNSFGPPEEMAQTLMQEVSPQEYGQYRRWQVLFKLLAAVFIAVWVMFTAYVYVEKSIPIIVNETITEDTEPIINSNMEGTQ